MAKRHLILILALVIGGAGITVGLGVWVSGHWPHSGLNGYVILPALLGAALIWHRAKPSK